MAKKPSKRDPRTVYYILAISNFFEGKASQCLLEEISERFQEKTQYGLELPLLVDSDLLDHALDRLIKAEVVEVDRDKFGPPIVSSRGKLADALWAFNRSETDVINRYLKAGDRRRSWLLSALEKLKHDDEAGYGFVDEEEDQDNNSIQEIPASDRYVKLDDNAPNYQEAIDRLEELIDEASKIRVNDWPEKEGIIQSLKSSLEMVKTKYVSRDVILAAVSSAITFILTKFAEAPIVDVANRAWIAVKNLF